MQSLNSLFKKRTFGDLSFLKLNTRICSATCLVTALPTFFLAPLRLLTPAGTPTVQNIEKSLGRTPSESWAMVRTCNMDIMSPFHFFLGLVLPIPWGELQKTDFLILRGYEERNVADVSACGLKWFETNVEGEVVDVKPARYKRGSHICPAITCLRFLEWRIHFVCFHRALKWSDLWRGLLCKEHESSSVYCRSATNSNK